MHMLIARTISVVSVYLYVVLKVEKVTHTSDATLHVNGGEIHASAEGQDMYAAIDGLIDKLARQLTKHKDKLKQH